MEIAEKVVVVTGGGSGIGEAIARRMAAEGARAAIVDVDGVNAQRVAEGVDGLALAADVGDETAVAQMLRKVEDQLGPIDIFVSNAGLAMGGSVDVPTDQWQRIWDVNLMATVYAARHLLPSMMSRGGGHIVVTASAAGLLTNLGAAPYAVTKHAAVALAEWLAITYGEAGIGVSVVCPEFVRTPMLERAAEELGTDEWFRHTAIEPDRVADALMEGLAEGRFMILPHPQIGEYFKAKALDYDGWIRGMQKLQRSLGVTPPAS